MTLTKCKDCGRPISERAPVCPHCGAPLKSQDLGCGSTLAILLILAAVAWYFLAPPGSLENVLHFAATKTNLGSVNISGAVWLTHGSGESTVMRGTQVILCRASATEALRRAASSEDPQWEHVVYFNLKEVAIPKIQQVATENAVATMATDINGAYRFSGIPPNNYLLFASFANETAAGIWLIPVNGQEIKDIKLNLDNSNLTIVGNKHSF